MVKISVAIATFNRKNLLMASLEALKLQTLDAAAFEVIICDSQSIDGTAEMVSEYSKKMPYKLTYLKTTNNLARKRNLGIDRAKGKFVIFLDDDCIPDPSFLETHLKSCLSTVGQKIAYCGEVRYPKEWINKSNYYRFRDSRHFGFSSPSKRLDSLDYRTIVVMNMSFEKKIFLDHIGAVNEAFVGYGAEDQDLGWRMQEAGYRLVPTAARITHFETTSSISQYGDKIRRSSRDGMATLLRVNRPAALGIETLKKIDSAFPERSLAERLTRTVVILAVQIRLGRILEKSLEFTDGWQSFYSPKLYRLLMGIYHVEGSLARDNSLTPERAELGWG